MPTGLTIGQLSVRSGFPASTLRFYDQEGLVLPETRTDAGYRLYSEAAVQRLAFVSRAKELDCSLDEIRRLLIAWEGGRCGPLQDELRSLVRAKIDDVDQRVGDLNALSDELRRSASALERHRPDGNCDDRCGCVDPVDVSVDVAAVAVPLGRNPVVACTLPADSVDDRLTDWTTVLEHTARRIELDDGMRVEFEPTVPGADLMRLVTAEQTCCRFLRFAITADDRGMALEVRSEAAGVAVVRALFAARA